MGQRPGQPRQFLGQAGAKPRYHTKCWETVDGDDTNQSDFVMHVRAAMLAALLAAGATPALGLPHTTALTQFVRDVWQSDQGLPQNYINAIVQTRDGYLWIGTEEGLVRFDGVRFITFDRRNTPSFQDHNVQALYAAADGTLWVGTRAGGVVSLKNQQFTRFTTADGLPSDRVMAITSDRSGAIWIATNGGGLSRLKDRTFTTFTTRDGLSDDRVAYVAEDRDGDLWIGTLGGGVTRRRGNRFVAVDHEVLRGQSVVAITAATDGTVWIGTDRGLVRAVNGAIERFAPAASIDGVRVMSMVEDRDGTIWVGTNNGGLGAVRGGRFDVLTAPGLTSNVIVTLAEDREGSLWIGTGGGGINRLRQTSFTAVTPREGLPHEIALATFEDREGVMWIGTYGGGVATIRNGVVTPLAGDALLSRSIVNAVGEDTKGSVWIGTGNAGVFRFDRQTRRIDRFTTADGLASDATYALLVADNDVWVGTRGGLTRIRGREVTAFSTRDGLPNDYVRALAADPDGSLWVGTNGGGLRRFKDGVFSTPIQTTGLASFIRAIHRDADGTLWIGTSGGGLLRATAEGGTPWARVTALTMQDGLPDDVVFQILEDGAGNLWLSSNRGIARVAKADIAARLTNGRAPLRVTAFGRSDGMPSAETNGGFQPAGWRAHDGRLWFPTVKGVVAVDPAHLIVNTMPPPVVIEEASVDRRKVDPQIEGRFPAGYGELEFHYTALSLVDPSRVRFRYQLEGFDRDWVEAGDRRVAFYTNMPSGRYTFRVRAANNDGVWSQDAATFSFALAPHFYQTPWFYAIVVLAVIGTVSAAYRLRLARAQARETELLRLVEERTSQLQQANDHLQRLSYIDALTNIPNRRHFEEILEVEWRRAFRSRTPIALLMLDIDHFKAYNDTFGHRAGDACLTRVAAVLDESVQRAGDLVARYGGEEFAAILAGTELSGAIEVGERLRAAVEALAIGHADGDTHGMVTLSVGIAVGIPGDVSSSEALLGAADKALYQAKRDGRNLVRVAAGHRDEANHVPDVNPRTS